MAFAGYHSTAAFASPAPRTRAQDGIYVPFGIGSTYRRTASWWTTTSGWYGPEGATVLPLVQLCHSSHTGGRFSMRAYVNMCVNVGTISLKSIFGLTARKWNGWKDIKAGKQRTSQLSKKSKRPPPPPKKTETENPPQPRGALMTTIMII